MSRTFHHGRNRDRHIRVKGIRRQQTDLRKLARVIIDYALADLEAAAQRGHGEQPTTTPSSTDTYQDRKSTPPKRGRETA